MKKTSMYLSPECDVQTLLTGVVCTSTLTLTGESVENLDTGNENDLGNDW